MSEDNHDVKIVNGLIETTLDSVNGYREAAKEARNANFKTTFEKRAAERESVVRDLQSFVASQGGKAEEDGTALASAHRFFVNLRASLGKEDKAVVEEVERGEDHIKAKYEDALKDDKLSAAAKDVVQRAYGSVRQGHDQMRDLKHTLEGKA